MVPAYSTTNAVFTMQIARYEPVGKTTEETKQRSFWYLLEQCSSSISSSVIRISTTRSLSRLKRFHKGYRKILRRSM